MRDFRYMAIVAAAALGLAVAGCGGGGDDGLSTSEEQQLQDDKKAAEAEAQALRDQIAELREALGLEPAGDDDPTASIEDLNTQVADLKQQIADAEADDQKKATEAEAADALALFNGFRETDTDLTVSGNTAAGLADAISDKHGGGAASVVSSVLRGLTPGVSGDDVVKSSEPMLGKWQGTMLSESIAADAATNPGASSTVVVYTDIEAPKRVPFGDVYELEDDGHLANAAVVLAANRPKVKASAFVHTGEKNHAPKATSQNAVDVVVPGTFNGASGEYRCHADGTSACVSHDAGNGIVRLAGTGWIFDPDLGAMALQADASYAYFGWWLNKGTDPAGVEAGVFHGVTDLTGEDAQLGAPTSINALGGEATYTGAAAGKYAINPSLSSAMGGHWTADAELKAEWGNETTPGTISGTIDEFMADGQKMPWSITLGKTDLQENGTFSATGGVTWAISDVDGSKAGSWAGGLRAEGDDKVPEVVTGVFSATHGTTGNDDEVGHMVGAFGAHKQ